MFLKKQICPNCKTGKESYDLDPQSEVCPYIDCLHNGKCRFYVPLEKSSKKDALSGNKNKDIIKSIEK